MADAGDGNRRIVNVSLDERMVVRRSPEVEHERAVAIFDLIEENDFALIGATEGPYSLHLSIEENRLVIDVRHADETLVAGDVVTLEPGLYVSGVGGVRVESLGDLYRKLWSRGDAGVEVPLDVLRGLKVRPVVVVSGDRYRYLRLNPTY